jgi:hypothetical protein
MIDYLYMAKILRPHRKQRLIQPVISFIYLKQHNFRFLQSHIKRTPTFKISASRKYPNLLKKYSLTIKN